MMLKIAKGYEFSLLLTIIFFSMSANAVKFSTIEMKKILEPKVYYSPARVATINNTTISSEITGKIIEINKTIGEQVQANEILLKIDPATYIDQKERLTSEKATIETDLKLLQWQYKNSKKLYDQQNISYNQLLEKETALKNSEHKLLKIETELKTATRNIENCQIKAPFSGVISKKFVDLGEIVIANNNKLFELIQDQALEIIANLHNDEVISISKSNNILFQSSGKNEVVRLKNIVNYIDPETKTQTVTFQTSSKNLIHGQTGTIRWQGNQIFLPKKYTTKYKNQTGIFILKKKKAKFIMLESHKGLFKAPEIDDAMIIIQGKELLTDQAPIHQYKTHKLKR